MHGVGPGSVLGGRYAVGEPVTRHPRYERWTADDHTLNRPVVVLCFPASSPRASAVADAARRAAGIDEPRLTRVLDVGSSDTLAWVVEEPLADGHTLAHLLADGPLPAEEVRRIVGESAAALATAAVRGLHHGTLSPLSVRRGTDGAVTVRGLATEAALLGADDPDPGIAARTDAVSLVALAYAGLTSRWPLVGVESGLDPAPVVVGGVASPSEIVAGVPADLDTIARLTLVRDQGPLTPADLAAQIAPWSATPYAAPRPTPSRPRPAPSSTPPSTTGGSPAGGDRPAEGAGRTILGMPVTHGADDTAGVRRAVRRQRVGLRLPRVVVPAGGAPAPSDGATAPAVASATTSDRKTEPSAPSDSTSPRTPTAPTTPSTPSTPPTSPPLDATAPGAGDSEPLSAPDTEVQTPPPAASAPATPSATTPATPTAKSPRALDDTDTQGIPVVTATSHAAKSPAAVSPAEPSPTGRGRRGSRPMRMTRNMRLSEALAESAEPPESPAPLLGRQVALGGRHQSSVALLVVGVLVVLALVVGWGGVSRIGSSQQRSAAAVPSSTPTASATTSAGPAPTASATPSTAAALQPLSIVGSDAWDPQGDQQEGNASAPRAYDGNPDTMWRSQAYQSAPFGGYAKTGIGLVLDLGQPSTVHQVGVLLRGGADFTAYVASVESLDGATKIGSSSGVDGQVTITVPSGTTAKGSLIILWFTKLAPDGSGAFRAQVAEVTAS